MCTRPRTPPAASLDGPEHHRLAAALDIVGEVYASALLAFVGPHRPEHWELVLEQYEREHPQPGHAA